MFSDWILVCYLNHFVIANKSIVTLRVVEKCRISQAITISVS